MIGSRVFGTAGGRAPVLRFTPRLEGFDSRVLPGGLAGGVLTSGAFFAVAHLGDQDSSSHSNRDAVSTVQHGKPGGTTDGLSGMGQADFSPGSKPGGAGVGIR